MGFNFAQDFLRNMITKEDAVWFVFLLKDSNANPYHGIKTLF